MLWWVRDMVGILRNRRGGEFRGKGMRNEGSLERLGLEGKRKQREKAVKKRSGRLGLLRRVVVVVVEWLFVIGRGGDMSRIFEGIA